MATVTITKSSAPKSVTLLSTPLQASNKPVPGRLGNLTAAQSKALETLKSDIQNEGWFVEQRMDDATLLRFLRARKFDVVLAKKMLKECETWRKEFGVDELVETFEFKEKADVDKYYPQYYHKTDKSGQPLYIERLGNLDMKALHGVTTEHRVIQRLVVEYERFLHERAPACSTAHGRDIETSCTILDLGGVSLSNFVAVRDYVNQASSIGQNRYPECMGKFYIINAPWAFGAVWRLIKPWLDAVTVSKVDIMGSDYKPKLLAQIPKENLPKDLGGSCECEGGCSLSDAGPWNERAQAP